MSGYFRNQELGVGIGIGEGKVQTSYTLPPLPIPSPPPSSQFLGCNWTVKLALEKPRNQRANAKRGYSHRDGSTEHRQP
jgi:hypothetical protein